MSLLLLVTAALVVAYSAEVYAKRDRTVLEAVERCGVTVRRLVRSARHSGGFPTDCLDDLEDLVEDLAGLESAIRGGTA